MLLEVLPQRASEALTIIIYKMLYAARITRADIMRGATVPLWAIPFAVIMTIAIIGFALKVREWSCSFAKTVCQRRARALGGPNNADGCAIWPGLDRRGAASIIAARVTGDGQSVPRVLRSLGVGQVSKVTQTLHTYSNLGKRNWAQPKFIQLADDFGVWVDV